MKYLPLELAQHPLLIKAFTGEDGRFTTEKVWAKITIYGQGAHTFEEPQLYKTGSGRDEDGWDCSAEPLAPAAYLEELLELAFKLTNKAKRTKAEINYRGC